MSGSVHTLNYIASCLSATCRRQGIFGWTLMDNFEWAAGTDWRFGIIRTDFETLQRYYKASSLWLSNKFGLSDVKSAADAVASVASTA